MKITLLGTGSPEADPRRASSGYLVQVDDCNILLDCGGGVVGRLLQAGLLPSDITHLFFTHLHSDHMMDYARLIHAAWDEGAKPLKVYGPAPLKLINEKLFGIDGVFSSDLTARTEHKGSQRVWLARGGTLPRPWPQPVIEEIQGGFEFSSEGWILKSCEVPHAQPHLHCMAFSIEANDKKFVYSGDAGLCSNLEQLADGADLLLHWCYRLHGESLSEDIDPICPDPLEIAQLAKRCRARQLVLTHFRKHMDTDLAHSRTLDVLKQNFDGPCAIAEDLMQYTL